MYFRLELMLMVLILAELQAVMRAEVPDVTLVPFDLSVSPSISE